MGKKHGFRLPGRQLERLGLRIEIDEQQATENFHLNRLECKLALVKIDQLLGVSSSLQLAVEAIGPGVIGAGDGAQLAAAEQQFMAAMLTHVVVGPQFAALVTNDDDILLANLHRQVTPRFSKLALMADIPPVAVEHGFLLTLINIAIEVIASWHRIGLFGIANKRDITTAGFQLDDAHG